jgi:hypothetical protein
MSGDEANETTPTEAQAVAGRDEPLPEDFCIDRSGQMHRKLGHEQTTELAQDISRWVNQEISIGVMVPDFWDECETSERLAAWLTDLGYRKVRSDAE